MLFICMAPRGAICRLLARCAICWLLAIYEKASKVSIIDHHRAGDVEFNNLVSNYVETSASSAVELVTEMFTGEDDETLEGGKYGDERKNNDDGTCDNCSPS